MTRYVPAALAELGEAVQEVLRLGEPLELVAGGSKRGLGRPLQLPHTLDLGRLGGIRDYVPSELVLTAGAATPLALIEAALAPNRQMLAFEPPDWRGLLGGGGEPTLGGVLACNLSGPRRIRAGAARDHFLGCRGVSGRGAVFKAGGKVVKNVTGYDLPKLMAGSYGTLAALEEVTVKVLPRPETSVTVLLGGLSPEDATRQMAAALGSPHEISGASYLPAEIASSLLPDLPGRLAPGLVALRLEGPGPSVEFRRDCLLREAARANTPQCLDEAASGALWRAIGDATPLAGIAHSAVWRISVAPSRGAALGVAIAESLAARWYLDWGGGLLWAAVAAQEDGGSAVIRRALAQGGGPGAEGHATLIAAPPGLRRAVAVFEPLAEALALLNARVKESFDPHHILNPGRMVARG